MTLDEAIDMLLNKAERIYFCFDDKEQSKELLQIAEYLQELRAIKESQWKGLWVAIESDDKSMFLYDCKPRKNDKGDYFFSGDCLQISRSTFPELKYEDKPIKVKLVKV